MVKLPSLDDLKKMGSDLLDSAKTVNLTGMVDKLKTGIESVGKKSEETPQGDEAVKNIFQAMYVALNELTAAQAAQASAVKKIQAQVVELAKVVESYQKSIPAPEQKEEQKKP